MVAMDLPQEERSLKKVLNCGSNLSFRRVSSHHWVRSGNNLLLGFTVALVLPL